MSEQSQTEYDKLLQHQAPQIAAQIMQAKDAGMAHFHPSIFQDQPDVMYAAVQYANKLGVHLCFYPDKMKHPLNHTGSKS
jgi:hypothetical protein